MDSISAWVAPWEREKLLSLYGTDRNQRAAKRITKKIVVMALRHNNRVEFRDPFGRTFTLAEARRERIDMVEVREGDNLLCVIAFDDDTHARIGTTRFAYVGDSEVDKIVDEVLAETPAEPDVWAEWNL